MTITNGKQSKQKSGIAAAAVSATNISTTIGGGGNKIPPHRHKAPTRKRVGVVDESTSTAAGSAQLTQIDHLPTDMSDSSDSEAGMNIPPFVCTAECDSMHEGRQLVHTILPINVDTLFSLLFSKSKFLVDFHNIRKTTNMIHQDWSVNADGVKSRQVTLTVALAQAVGPKCSHVSMYLMFIDIFLSIDFNHNFEILFN